MTNFDTTTVHVTAAGLVSRSRLGLLKRETGTLGEQFVRPQPVFVVFGEIQIQRATVAVAEQLAEVYRSAYLENRRLGLPNEVESAAEMQVTDWIQQNTVYVAKSDGEVIGGVRLDVTDLNRVKLS